MSDVLDEIINRLPPSTLKIILDFKKDTSRYSDYLSSSLKEAQQIKINQINKELKRKIVDLKSKTTENKSYLDNFKRDLETFKVSKASDESQQSIRAYSIKINELENQLKNLTKDHIEVDLTKLFNNVESTQKQIEDYKNKIAKAKSKYQYFDGFPPDIEQGKKAISQVKECIKYHESVIESLY